MGPDNRLNALFEPEKIAVYGEAGSQSSFFSRCIMFLKSSRFKGRLFPVNEEYSQVMGVKCFRDIASIPEIPDLILIESSMENLLEIITASAEKGIPFGIIFSAFQNQAFKEQLKTHARYLGMRLLGPNSQGILNLALGIPLTCSIDLTLEPQQDSHIALVSRSGSLAFACFTAARERGVKFRYLVTTGDQADLDDLEIATGLLKDKHIDLIILYLEDVTEGSRLLNLFQEAGKHDVALAVLKASSQQLSSLSSKYEISGFIDEEEIWEAAFEHYGVIRLRDVEDIPNLASLFSLRQKPRGPRVGLLSSSRGAGILMSDHCRNYGLQMADLSPDTREKLERVLPAHGSSKNPVNLTSLTMEDPGIFEKSLEILLNADETDVIIPVITTAKKQTAEKISQHIASRFSELRKPMVCCWLSKSRDILPSISLIKESGVPLFDSFSQCASALSRIVQLSCFSQETEEKTILSSSKITGEIKEEFTEYDAKQLLHQYGTSVTREELCNTLQEAIEAAENIGYPVALKVMSPDILRKTQARVIALNLKDAEEVRNAYGRTLERAARSNPDARISGVLIQEMLNQGIECMICARRHPVFGPVVSVGLGGIYVEFLNDRSTRLAPLSRSSAREMIEQLNGYPLLKGVWGTPGYSVDSLAQMVSMISEIITLEEQIQEINIDPVFVMPSHSVVVDAFIIRR